MESEIDQWLEQTYPSSVVDALNEKFVKRVVEMFTKKGDIILDAFAGTGVIAATASGMGRNVISNDVSPDASKSAQLRYLLTHGEKNMLEKVRVI
jgi:DNA modification methylase